MESINLIVNDIKNCKLCDLHKTKLNSVPGVGASKNPKILFIGEAPGEEEDKQGMPFVGKAGKFLTELIDQTGFSREDVYIANILKCRPPKNRNPLPEEIKSCTPFLTRQINFLKPRVICSLGNFSMKFFMGEEFSISKVHGRFYDKNDFILFCSYHPAAALYNPSLKEEMKNDFVRLKKFIKFKLGA